MASRLLAVLILMSGVSRTFAQWQVQSIATDSDFRGLCVVNDRVAWVSGTKGTFGRTIDAGITWTVGNVPDASALDFRDVQAFGESTAYLLSAGPGDASRIYKTTDGGHSWTEQFRCSNPKSFLDALAFWDDKNGIALGDPVNGKFQLITTNDGGTHWRPLPIENLPQALPNEGCFAASGTCIVAHGANDVWFATGGAKAARVFHSHDRGQTWTFSETPVTAGADSAGIFSIAFRDSNHGMIVGGDYRKPNERGIAAAITTDGGKTWTAVEKPLPFRSCVAWSKDRWVAVGSNGSDFALGPGLNWNSLDRENYNCAAFTSSGNGWAAGPKGRIAKFLR